MALAQISYSFEKIQSAEDLVVAPVSNGANVSYGDYTGIPLAKRSNNSFTIRYTNISQTVHNNGSVTVSFRVTFGTLRRTVVSTAFPANATVTAKIDGVTFWNHTEPVTVPSSHPGYTRSFSVTVPPLGTSWAAAIHFYNDMSVADDEFRAGMRIYNPNPPDYRPGQQLISGKWQSHNRGAGKANKREGGSWSTMRTQDGGSGTGNPPSLRTSGTWRNQRKIGNNAG